LQANEVLFVDSEHEDEVLTFREVFLGSRALELLLAGFIAEPPSTDEEHALLASLLSSTLGGDAALHQVTAAVNSTVPAVHAVAGARYQQRAAQSRVLLLPLGLSVRQHSLAFLLLLIHRPLYGSWLAAVSSLAPDAVARR
jgi:hypothetical protein